MARFAVVAFPGTTCAEDTVRALRLLGEEVVLLPHDARDLGRPDCVVLPGGFAYGDYLRPGALARAAPALAAVLRFAEAGGAVLGICNGFQILVEAGLLPGAFLRNERRAFVCRPVRLVRTGRSPLLAALPETIVLPVAHGAGRYFADPATLRRLEAEGAVALRYAPGENPNGSIADIAAVTSARGNVLGLMPHPERAVEEEIGGTAGTDGRKFFASILAALPVPARPGA